MLASSWLISFAAYGMRILIMCWPDLQHWHQPSCPMRPHCSHRLTTNSSELATILSFSSAAVPYAMKQSFSISPNLRPPSFALPSRGYRVRNAFGPVERACILSLTMCFSL